MTDSERLYFLYGSETGNSESIAKRLHHDAVNSQGYPAADCMTLNQAVTKKLLDAQMTESAATPLCVVIVCSTTGEGEPPENAARFRRWLRNTKGSLYKVRYTVLALGDSNYNNFCTAGKFIDSKLSELGAARCFPRGEADDGVDLDLVVVPWVENVWSGLSSTSGPAVGPESYTTGGQRVDMAVAQEAAIVYSNASLVCATLALFLYERVMELGGKADLYPIQYFAVEELVRPAKIVLFLLSTDSDEDTLCQHCAAAGLRQPPLGPFTELFFPTSAHTALSDEGAKLRQWLADPTLRFYNAICVVPHHESIPTATALDARVREVAVSCKLDFLCKQQANDEVRTIVDGEEELFAWAVSVMDNLPGVTADRNTIHRSFDYFFDSRVGVAFRAARHRRGSEECGSHSVSGPRSAGVPQSVASSPSLLSRLPTVAADRTATEMGDGGAAAPRSQPAPSVCSTHGSQPRQHHHHHHENGALATAASRSGQASAATGAASVPFNPGLQMADVVLAPIVLLYNGHSSLLTQISQDLYKRSGENHLRVMLMDLANFSLIGFPRRATFVFIVSGALTKSMARVLKTLRGLQSEGTSAAGAKFAILGVDELGRSEKFNMCTLELETQLLSLSAMKIHCTGLGDTSNRATLRAVIDAWESNLWGAIMNPTASMAYLDAASPFISAGQTSEATMEESMLTSSDPQVAALLSPLHLEHSFSLAGGKSRLGNPNSGASFPRSSSAVASSPSGMAPTTSDSTAAFAGKVTAGSPMTAHVTVSGRAVNSGSPLGEGSGRAVATPTAAVPSATATTTTTALDRGANLFPWDAVPLNRERAPSTPVTFLYSSSGMPKTMAVHASQTARDLGFPTQVLSFANYHRVDFVVWPNVILFCESAPDGQSHGGRRFKKFLQNPSRDPDHFSFLRFGVLGLGQVPSDVVHPAFLWASLLSRLQANRVFPVVVMSSMSQMYALGLPWCECVLATMALLPPSATSPGAVGAPSRVSSGALLGGSSAVSAPDAAAAVELQPGPGKRILFLFGSVTGTSEAIARDLHREALERGYHSRVAALKYFEKMNFLSTDTVVIVCSTVSGNSGGFPDNARKFARYVRHKEQPKNLLSGTRFAVLGLGNADAYPGTYCRAAATLNTRLAELGGARVCEMGEVDTAQAITQPVEDWRRLFFSSLQKMLMADIVKDAAAQWCTTPTPGSGNGTLDSSADAAAAQGTLAAVASASEADSPPGGRSAAHDTRQDQSRVLVVHCSPPTSAVPDIAEHLRQQIIEHTALQAECCTLNELAKRNWRSHPQLVTFVVASSGESDYPFNGSSFFRLLRQKNNPHDLFSSVRYTVLAISDNNEGRFYLGRQLDRRLEELGGTRFYARGEAVDSFSLEKTVERWITGLLTTLTAIWEATQDDDVAGVSVNGFGEGGAGRFSGGGNAAAAFRGDAGTESVVPLIALAGEADDNATGRAPVRNTAAVAGGGREETARTAFGAPLATAATETSSLLDRIAYSSTCAVPYGERADGVVHSWVRLTSDSAAGTVLQLNLTVPPNTRWIPGQTVAILPTNDTTLVNRLLRRFDVRGDAPFHPLSVAGNASSVFPTSPLYTRVDFPASIGTVLQRYVSLRVTKSNKGVFQVLEKCATTAERKAAVQQAFHALAAQRYPRELADVLDDFPDLNPSLRHLLEHLPALQPRLYSICSSHAKDPTLLSVCFKVVPHGLCTNWLQEQCLWTDPLCPPHTRRPKGELVIAKRRCVIPFVIRTATEFRMPRDPLVPLILIGPGTGVAPFRAFLQEREVWLQRHGGKAASSPAAAAAAAGKDVSFDLADLGGDSVERDESLSYGSPTLASSLRPPGTMDLYFGCHTHDEDFLFAKELVAYEEAGVLNSLQVAFSREPNEGAYWYGGCYVQDKMIECGTGLCDMIVQQNAHVLVCGDADNMAKEVHKTLVELLQQHLCLSEKAALEYVDNMMKTGQYVRDVWSSAA